MSVRHPKGLVLALLSLVFLTTAARADRPSEADRPTATDVHTETPPDALAPILGRSVTTSPAPPADFRSEDYFDEEAPQNVLSADTQVEADLVARELIRQFEEQIQVACAKDKLCTRESFIENNGIIITHKGERWGRRLSWIVGHLKHAGFKVRVFRRKAADTPDAISELERQEMKLPHDLWVRLHHDAESDTELKKLVDANELNEGTLRSAYRSVSAQVRTVFGLYDGLSWGWYSDNKTGFRRPLRWQLFEVAMGLPRALVAGLTTWGAARGLAAKYPGVNTVNGIVAAAVMQLVWAYIDRPNKLRHAQGVDFREDQKTADTNRFTFSVSCFVDSIFINLVLLYFQHDGFANIPYDRGKMALWNSVVGLFAKLLPEMLLAKGMKTGGKADSLSKPHAAWLTVTASTVLAVVMGWIKYGHFNEWHWGYRAAYESLMYMYFGYEIWNHFFVNKDPNVWGGTGNKLFDYALMFGKTVRKDWRRALEWLGLRKPVMCETLLSVRPLTPAELADPARNGIL